jgi:hypothetical protein
MYAEYAMAEASARTTPKRSMLWRPPASTSDVPAVAAARAIALRGLQRSRPNATAPSMTRAG